MQPQEDVTGSASTTQQVTAAGPLQQLRSHVHAVGGRVWLRSNELIHAPHAAETADDLRVRRRHHMEEVHLVACGAVILQWLTNALAAYTPWLPPAMAAAG